MARAATADLVGVLLDGRYRVLEHLADGGMASVYLGTDLRLDRDVAIKVMRPDLAADEQFVSRFRREARSAARLAHPNVVAVHDQGESADGVFLVMEHVPGQTLRQVLDSGDGLRVRAALDIVQDALAGLAAAHRAGLVHRDIKPENVLIREDGAVKVADFGLARAVTSQTATGATGVLLGTVSYLSPEQVQRGIADARSDVYAIGLVLFEMLTGRKAVDGETPIHVAFQHVHGDTPTVHGVDPQVPLALCEVVDSALQRDPDLRPRDAGELLERVARARTGLTDAELDRRPEPGPPGTDGPEPHRTERQLGRPTVAQRSEPTEGALSGVVVPQDRSPQATAPQRRSPLRWLPVLLLLAAGAAAGLWYLTIGQVTTVPDVAGQELTGVEARIADAELSLTTREAFDEEVPAGVAVRSTPVAGSETRKGSEVVVIVSKGPERFAVPDLLGMTQAEASEALGRVELAAGSVSQAFDEDVPEGQVRSSSPEAGAELRRDATVDLVLSKGPEPIPIPSVVQQPVAAATATLEGAGFVVTRAEDVFDPKVPKGAVVSQEPASGTGYRGDTVTVTVSKGPEMVTVPDVDGKTEAQARSALEGAGLTVSVQKFLGGPLDRVRATSPASGTRVVKGSTVTILVV
ncbi:Stk1 family PASTA domain-containing Ser/Thr kinase [Marihabitans asiaticum]|uniref:non-specific serine/threonine protein kinase n=1 Tax=Marihabitans asiaticum TaxID=415218 RepID=A0A560W6W9_9MICO|nr:Stk1 family PASTA domain-containing Ser/Thr kinase [Marihabitans asiaticum]TWD13370.1 serine/threonine-protein kinase [Marihabitans asiaticum]